MSRSTPITLANANATPTPPNRAPTRLALVAESGGRSAPLPLQPHETHTELERHARGYYFLIVLPGRRQVSCRTHDRTKAKWFKERFDAGLSTEDPGRLKIGPILEAIAGRAKPQERTVVKALLRDWRRKTVADVTPESCKAYYEKCIAVGKGVKRPKDSTLRRRIARLASHLRKAVGKTYPIETWLPPRGAVRSRWLRRSEAARLLWACRGRIWDKRAQRWRVDPATGSRILREPDAIAKGRMLARLVLLGLHTGSRLQTMMKCRWTPGRKHGHICFIDDRFYRSGSGEANSVKAAPPVALSWTLRTCLAGWKRQDLASAAYHRSGNGKVIYGLGNLALVWRAACIAAGLNRRVVRHTMRHTKATWLLEQGLSEQETADFIGVTVATLLSVYAQVNWKMTVAAAAAFDRAVGRDPATRRSRIIATRRKRLLQACRERRAARLRAKRLRFEAARAGSRVGIAA